MDLSRDFHAGADATPFTVTRILREGNEVLRLMRLAAVLFAVAFVFSLSTLVLFVTGFEQAWPVCVVMLCNFLSALCVIDIECRADDGSRSVRT